MLDPTMIKKSAWFVSVNVNVNAQTYVSLSVSVRDLNVSLG